VVVAGQRQEAVQQEPVAAHGIEPLGSQDIDEAVDVQHQTAERLPRLGVVAEPLVDEAGVIGGVHTSDQLLQ
jgi:hypothetical protein